MQVIPHTGAEENCSLVQITVRACVSTPTPFLVAMPLSRRRLGKDDDDQVIKVNPTVNAIFTSVFLAQVVGAAALFFSLGVVWGMVGRTCISGGRADD